MTLALRLFLGGILKKLGSLNIWQLLLIGLALFAGLQTIRVAAEKRHSAKVEAQLLKCDQARHADREAYAKAQAEAASKNAAQVAKVEQQYKRNSDDERQAYLDDLARLRAQRVRGQGSAAQGAAGSPGTPTSPAPASGAHADGLRLSPDEHLQASEIELRLMHLQNWVARQLGVDPNK